MKNEVGYSMSRVIPLITLLALLLLAVPQEAMAQSPSVSVNMTVAPETLIADGSEHQAVYVQLTDAEGVPLLTSADIEIQLTSSNPFVATVQPTLNIAQSDGFGVAVITTTLTPGGFTVIASIRGEAIATASGRTIQSVAGDLPLQIRAEAAPEILISHSEPHGLLSIVLVNAQGLLAAPQRDLTLALQSSDPEIIRVQRVATVRAGDPFMTVDLVPLDPGTATISVVAPGYLPDFIEVHSVPAGGPPDSLNVFAAPSLMRRVGAEPHIIIVQALDHAGLPTYFPCTNVRVASSHPEAIEVVAPNPVGCSEQEQIVFGTVWPGNQTGVAVVSVTAEGLRPDTTEVTVQGRPTAALLVTVLPTRPFGSSATPGFILVETVDKNGVPTREHGTIPFTIVGASDVAPPAGEVAAGESYVVLPLQGGSLSQTRSIWIVASDLPPASVQVAFVSPLLDLEIKFPGRVLYPGDTITLDVRVRSSGVPVDDAVLQWEILGRGSFELRSEESDMDGAASAVFRASAPGDIRVQVRASKPAYSAQTTEIVIPVLDESARDASRSVRIFGIRVEHLLTLTAFAVLAQIGWTSRLFFRRRRNIGVQ